MGLAKSFRKADYLSGVKEGLTRLSEILEASRKRKEQQQFYSTVSDLYNKWKGGQQRATLDRDLKEGGQVTNIFSPENMGGKTTMGQIPSGLNLDVNIPESVSSQEMIAPSPPETQTREVPQKEKYQKGKENLNEFISAIVPLILNPDIGQEQFGRANVLSELATRQTEQLRPPRKTRSRENPFERTIVTDEYGDVIEEVPEKTKLEKEEYERNADGSHKIYTIEGQKYYNKIKRDLQGNQIDEQLTRVPKKGEGEINIRDKDDKEKALKDTVSELIANLRNFKPYTIDDEGGKIPMDAEDIKYEKDKTLEKIKLQLLSPRVYEFINNIETLWKQGDPTGSRKYLSPKELYNEAVKHAETGSLTEEEQDEIATYLKYYSEDIYKGLTK